MNRLSSLFVILAFSLLFMSHSHAKESWFCTEESSAISNGTVWACGIGLGLTEDLARAKAFDSARGEFKRLCNASGYCDSSKVTITPKRTTCGIEGGQYKCYRLVLFRGEEEVSKISKLEKRARFLFKGMEKEALIMLFGHPDDQYIYNGDRNLVYHSRKICARFENGCHVTLSQSGQVSDWLHIKPELLED